MTEGIKTLRQQLQKLFIAFYFKTQLVIHYIYIVTQLTHASPKQIVIFQLLYFCRTLIQQCQHLNYRNKKNIY